MKSKCKSSADVGSLFKLFEDALAGALAEKNGRYAWNEFGNHLH